MMFVLTWVGFTGAAASNDSQPVSLSTGIDPVIFTFNCIDGKPGDTICIPVTVENFNDIVIFQYEIIWNSNVLDFIDIQNPGSGSINVNADFNLSGPNSLKVIPLGFPIAGESLPDGTVLFEICFRIIGIPGSGSVLDISPYFDFEAVNPDGEVPVDSVPCNMTVQDASGLVGFVNSCGPSIAGGDGVIDVTVFGGTAPYSITWLETNTNTPGGPSDIMVEGGSMTLDVPAGNYEVLITDAVGTTVTYTIEVDALGLSIATRLRHPTCYKFENGTMWIKPQGGSAPFSFIWESLTNPNLAGSGFIRNAGDSSLVTSLPDGMYRIYVKDDNGCEVEIIAELLDNPFIINVTSIIDATCNGAKDGVIDFIITGATPDIDDSYTITLKPGFVLQSNMASYGLLDPGIYRITISDEISQCDTVFEFTIGSLTTITANVTATDPPCANGTNGSVSIRGLTNGVAGSMYSYAIYRHGIPVTSASDIGGAFNYSPLSPGDYMAIVTDDNGCLSDSIPFSIGNPEPLTVSIAGNRPDACPITLATGDIWFTITNGTAPYILSSSAGTQDGDTLENLNSGNYILTVEDANGCMITLPFTIYDGSVNEEADITFQINGIPCEEGSTLTVLYQGLPIPPNVGVLWNNDNTLVTPTIPIEESDTFSVDVILGPPIFCILDDTVIIKCDDKLDLDITIIQPSCHDEAIGGPFTGTVIVDTSNAVGQVTWIWSVPDTTNTNTYTGLAPGKYFVTVTDADTTVVDSFEIIAPDPIHFLFSVPDSTSCASACDGFVTLTPSDGDPSMDFFLYWTTTSANSDTGVLFQISDLCAGIQEFSLSQDGICFYEGEIEILAPDPIDINLVTTQDATCFRDIDGMIEVAASGGTPGYTYQWQGGPSSAIYNGIAAGEYFITATDSENCFQVDSFTIGEPDSLIAQIDPDGTVSLSCGTVNDGMITVDVTGGNNGGYTFTWNPDVSNNPQAVNLAAGEYLITVTDPKGCSDTTSYTLSSPPPIVVEWPIVTDPECFGDETVLLIENVTGGNGNYTFNINGSGLLEIGEPVMLPSGIYIISVFDDRGCAADTTYTIIEPNPILVSISPDNPIIDLGDSLFIMGQVDQSDLDITMMSWTSEAPVSCSSCEGTWVFNYLPTTYTWTVTDVNGCQGSASIIVDVDYDRDVFIPSAFSPNDDGFNDVFSIFTGQGVVSVNYLHIYDRWGNLIHSETDLLPNSSGTGSWNGTMDGSPLNPGVYVFIAEVQFIDNDTKLVYRGDVTLVK